MTDKVTTSDRYSDAQVTELTCYHCEAPIVRAKTGPPKKYCDKFRKSRAEWERNKARRAGDLDPDALQLKASLDTYMAYMRASAQRRKRRAERMAA